LNEHMSKHQDHLTEVDRERLRRNPLRILDSKEEGIDKILDQAPKILDYLCDDCADHFSKLRSLLDSLEEPYSINPRLVRGIDYYTKTVFELWDKSIGAQSALVGGGRYDGLAEAIGGPSTPGVGVGIGIERIVIGLKKQGIEAPFPPKPKILLAHFGGDTKTAANKATYQLRQAGFGARIAFARDRRSMKSQMREANRQEVDFVIIVGSEELDAGEFTIKRMDSAVQTQVNMDQLVSWFESL
jgi:histidyl-tRNA synthetase